MIRNSPYGISPKITITIAGADINYNSLMSIKLDLMEGAHDMCKIVMSGVPARAITDYIGKSVSLQIELGSTLSNGFYGTIVKSLPTANTSGGLVNNSLIQTAEFICFGASYSMRGSSALFRYRQRLQDIASYFCDKYGFSLDVPLDDLIFPRLVQNDHSDWKFINRYANDMGYSLTLHGTHMHIFDPFKAKGRNISLHRFTSPARSSAAPTPGQIVQFTGSFSQRANDGKYFDSTASVMQDNGTTFDVVTSDMLGYSTPATYNSNLGFTVDNYSQAQRALEVSYKEEYDYKATVIAMGIPGVLPGGLVNIDGYSTEFDGLWYVHSSTQMIQSGSFLTTVDLRRNSVSTLVDISAPQFRVPPPPQFIGGTWTTTNRTVNAYS